MENSFLTSHILPFSFFLIMLGIGTNLSYERLIKTIKEKRLVVLGILFQMLLLPILAISIIYLFPINTVFSYGLLILSLCPGGASSNLFTYLAGGDLELSGLLTVITGCITPFSLPIVAYYLGNFFIIDNSNFIELDIYDTIKKLVLLGVTPLIIGLLLKTFYSEFTDKIGDILKKASSLFLAIIVIGIIIKNLDNINVLFLKAWLPTLTLNITAVSLVVLISKALKIGKKAMLTLSIETGIQNGMMALFITGTLIKDPVMSIVPATYSIAMYISAFLIIFLINNNLTKTKRKHY